jgi:hypothetical protein
MHVYKNQGQFGLRLLPAKLQALPQHLEKSTPL